MSRIQTQSQANAQANSPLSPPSPASSMGSASISASDDGSVPMTPVSPSQSLGLGFVNMGGMGYSMGMHMNEEKKNAASNTSTTTTTANASTGTPAASNSTGAGNAASLKRKPSRRANTAERRATHNAVERARRETLNSRFLDLASLLPNLSQIRRPSKSSIVNSSIALLAANRRHRLLAARELRTLKGEADALRRELNEWRDRAGIVRLDEPQRGEGFGVVLSGEVECVVMGGGMSNDMDEDDAYGPDGIEIDYAAAYPGAYDDEEDFASSPHQLGPQTPVSAVPQQQQIPSPSPVHQQQGYTSVSIPVPVPTRNATYPPTGAHQQQQQQQQMMHAHAQQQQQMAAHAQAQAQAHAQAQQQQAQQAHMPHRLSTSPSSLNIHHLQAHAHPQAAHHSHHSIPMIASPTNISFENPMHRMEYDAYLGGGIVHEEPHSQYDAVGAGGKYMMSPISASQGQGNPNAMMMSVPPMGMNAHGGYQGGHSGIHIPMSVSGMPMNFVGGAPMSFGMGNGLGLGLVGMRRDRSSSVSSGDSSASGVGAGAGHLSVGGLKSGANSGANSPVGHGQGQGQEYDFSAV